MADRLWAHTVKQLRCLAPLVLLTCAAQAQDDEFQVNLYRAGLLPPGTARVTLHTNYFYDGTVGINGTPFTKAGTYGNDRDVHETLETTAGLRPWAQVTLYTFSSIDGDRGLQWAGNHIKPTVATPESWHWPVRLSLGVQTGYQRARFSEDRWRVELRPAVERRFGRFDAAFSPLILRSLTGPGAANGFTFAANVRGSYRISRRLNLSVLILRVNEPQQQIFPLLTMHLPKRWDVSLGLGIRPQQTTDPYIPRLLIGRRFSFLRRRGGG